MSGAQPGELQVRSSPIPPPIDMAGADLETSIPQASRLRDQLTVDAQRNYDLIGAELARRLDLGLASTEKLSPDAQISRYLDALSVPQFRAVSDYVDALCPGARPLRDTTRMVVTIPVAGFGRQEYGRLTRLVSELAADPAVKAGLVEVIVFSNRPPGAAADQTAEMLRTCGNRLEVPLRMLEGEVPRELGRSDGDLVKNSHGNAPNRAPIALIRDVMSIAAMKMWQANSTRGPVPIQLQMDVDFEGFQRGNLLSVLQRFEADPSLCFQQSTSCFDDLHLPTAQVPLLRLGDDLMRELPFVLKGAIARADLEPFARTQIVFGEAIQRGIQVPQAERLESIARKGGYGLLRMSEDELDANLRTSALQNEFEGVGCCRETVFRWNSRRAILAYGIHEVPPISQWRVAFEASDAAREEGAVESVYAALCRDAARSEDYRRRALGVVNHTLGRFPLPEDLGSLYRDPVPAVYAALERCGVRAKELAIGTAAGRTVTLRAKSIEFVENA